MGPPGLSGAEQQQILDLYARGLTMKQVAQEIPCSMSTVWRYLHRHEAKVRQPWRGSLPLHGVSGEEQLRTAQLYGRGLSMKEVAAIMNVSIGTVHNRLRRLGVKSRPMGGSKPRS